MRINPNVTIIQPIKTAEKISKIRVAAYCRVSSDSSDQLNSFTAQMRYYESFLANSEKEILAGIYADEGVTGTCEDKREEFQRMMNDCRKGKIDRIYTKSISRFARNTKECLSTIRELKSLGITVMFEKENIDTANVTDEMMITIMGGLAQEESTSISMNMKWSYKKRMKSGDFFTNTPPYGYIMHNKCLEINPKKADTVKSIFDMYLNGSGIKSIINKLNEENYDKRWTYSSLYYLLTNEKYVGDTVLQKYYTDDNITFKRKVNKGEIERYYIKNSHNGIISREDFNKVQCLLKSKKQSSVNNKNITYRKMIKCGNCGSTFIRNKCRDKYYWVCRNHDERASNCSIKQIPEICFEHCFIKMYNKLKLNYSVIFSPLISQLQELKNRKFSGNKRYSEIMKEIASMKEQVHVLARLKTKGFLENDKYIEQTAEINSKVENLNRELQKISQCDD